MANGNGTNGVFKIFGWIAGAITFLLLIYSTFHIPLVNALSKETENRVAADDHIKKDVSDKLDKIAEQNTQTAVILAELKSDIHYIKAAKCQ